MKALKKFLSFYFLNFKIYGIRARCLRFCGSFKIIPFLVTVIGLNFLCYYGLVYYKTAQKTPTIVKVNFMEFQADHAVDTTGCIIPKFNKNIIRYRIREFQKCSSSKPSLLQRNLTHIWILTNNIKFYNDNNTEGKFWCCYEPIQRPLTADDILARQIEYPICTRFKPKEEIKVIDEFVKVTCLIGKKVIYSNLYLFAPKKEATVIGKAKRMKTTSLSYNVLVLGIDSVSRHNFDRRMPKTRQYLEKLGAIEMLGYSNVGERTLNSLAPLVLGLQHIETLQFCLYPHAGIQLRNECEFIWTLFKKEGFYTAVGETSAVRIYNNYQHIFGGPPPDYHFHLFNREVPRQRLFNYKNLCLQHEAYFEVLLNYIRDLTVSLNSTKMFGFFWEASMTNLYIDYPVLMDNSYQSFLKQLNDSKYLDRTVLFLLSNNGFNTMKDMTDQEKMEMRMPLLHVLVPPSFKNKYPDAYTNLITNRKRLTTILDVYKTLVALKNLRKLKYLTNQKHNHLEIQRGISLFSQISVNRTCYLASVDDYWCACRLSVPIAIDSKVARVLAETVIKHINQKLVPEKGCTRLAVRSIMNVTEFRMSFNRDLKLYDVVVRATPGFGLYLGKVERKKYLKVYNVTRINDYMLNDCTKSANLAPFCNCRI